MHGKFGGKGQPAQTLKLVLRSPLYARHRRFRPFRSVLRARARSSAVFRGQDQCSLGLPHVRAGDVPYLAHNSHVKSPCACGLVACDLGNMCGVFWRHVCDDRAAMTTSVSNRGSTQAWQAYVPVNPALFRFHFETTITLSRFGRIPRRLVEDGRPVLHGREQLHPTCGCPGGVASQMSHETP